MKNVHRFKGFRPHACGYYAVFGFSVVFISSILALGFYLLQYPNEVLEFGAREDAKIYSLVLNSFRTIYTKHVAQPAQERGVEVTHDLSKKGYSIPLPATMTRLLGEEMIKLGYGGGAYLYSPYPFPWRSTEGGLRDDFSKEAWAAINRVSTEPFAKFENINGIRTLRYATADVMQESCVQCHNSHPDSPRRDWKKGNVRGILEVRRAVAGAAIETSTKATKIFYLVAGIGLLGICGVIGMLFLIKNLKSEVAASIANEKVILEQQDQLIQSSKLASLGEMAFEIAHEINNPLFVISGSVGLLTALSSNPEKFTERIAAIQKASDRIAKIVSGLNKYSRRFDEKNFANYSLSKIIKESMVLTEEKAKKHNTTVSMDLRSETLVCCDEAAIEQVLVNLINNGIDAVRDQTEERGKWVKILLFDEGLSVVLRVMDSGLGIPEQIRNKLFDPFFTTKSVGNGTGLGLSISKGILDKHGASIKVLEGVANTCFEIRFKGAAVAKKSCIISVL